MDATQTSYDLLAHFDGEVAASPEKTDTVRTRGVAWVLRWAAALAVVFFSSVALAEFAYCLAAEHALVRAARVGALEATLPRASYKSVAESVQRRFTGYPGAAQQLRLAIQLNGVPLGRRFHPQPGDHISISLSVPSHTVIPSWLRHLTPWRHSPQISVSTERDVPGRVLKGSGVLNPR